MNKQDTFVSVVIVTINQAEILSSYIDKLAPFLNDHYSDYEIVIIDQNSTDLTDAELTKTLSIHQSIRYIKLTQKVHDDVAIAAGFENAIGDFVVNLNIESDPYCLVAKFVNEGICGSDIIVGISRQITSIFYKSMRIFSDKLIQSIGYTLPANSTGSLCLSRRAVNAVTESGRFYCKLHMRIANVGYKITSIPYDLKPNTPKKKVKTGIRDTIHHLIFNSTKPLRWMSILGVFGSIMAFIFSCYSLVINLINNDVTEGWTTTILFMSFLFAILFTMLAFFGEYLARLLNDRSEHKEYSVVFEKNSSVMLDENRHNVLFSSLKSDLNLIKAGKNQ